MAGTGVADVSGAFLPPQVSIPLAIGSELIGADLARDAAHDAEIDSQNAQASQAAAEERAREFATRQFGEQIERQMPFIEEGRLSLPDLVNAISNRGDVSQLPATQIQGDLINEFLGDQAPAFVKERAMADLEASELERNKGRLADLVNIGAGGVGSASGSSVNLGTTLGASLQRQGNAEAESLADRAVARENAQNAQRSGLAGIPAFINTVRPFKNNGGFSN